MQGLLGEMKTALDPHAKVIRPRYQTMVDDAEVDLNKWLGQGITLTYLNQLYCRHCARQVRKLYGGGHCYDCFSTLARCDLCVMSPDRCHFHLGTCREPEWAQGFCMQPHIVYLANTSGPKIGITRAGREHHRWLDQGASQAIAIVAAPTRRAAGVVEAHFSRRLNDRTDWRKLVTGAVTRADLVALAGQLRRSLVSFSELSSEVLPAHEAADLAWLEAREVTEIQYPVQRYSPARRLNLSGDSPQICDNLQGIVGRYLLFSQGVVNLADYAGARIQIALGPTFTATQVNDTDQLSLFD